MCDLRLVRISGNPPTSYFAIRNDGNYVGHCALHHEPQGSEHLPDGFDAHIYYEILPEYREHEHTHVALNKLVVAAHNIGIDEIFLIAPVSNLPPISFISSRDLEPIGEAEGGDGERYVRYRIQRAQENTCRV